MRAYRRLRSSIYIYTYIYRQAARREPQTNVYQHATSHHITSHHIYPDQIPRYTTLPHISNPKKIILSLPTTLLSLPPTPIPTSTRSSSHSKNKLTLSLIPSCNHPGNPLIPLNNPNRPGRISCPEYPDTTWSTMASATVAGSRMKSLMPGREVMCSMRGVRIQVGWTTLFVCESVRELEGDVCMS